MKYYIRDLKENFINEINQNYDVLPFGFKDWLFEKPVAEVKDYLSDPKQLDGKRPAFVSPANSFGWMDGGLDKYICDTLNRDIEKKAIAARKSYPLKEILVGQAELIFTNDNDWPEMIMAPTMRTPRIITDENVYLSTRAAVYVAHMEGIDALLLPGMGTGVGGVHPRDAAVAILSGINSVHAILFGEKD